MIAQWTSFIFFGVAGVIHFGFFVMEAFLLQKKESYKILRVSEDVHRLLKPWILNQGYYNLFLSLGMFVGLSLVLKKQIIPAGVLTSFCGLFMIGAGVVLSFSSPELRKWAWLQWLPPILGFIFLYFHIAPFLK